MLRFREFPAAAMPVWSVFVLVALVWCSGCGSKDSNNAPANIAAPAAAIPPQAGAAAQEQQRTDAAARAAHAPH